MKPEPEVARPPFCCNEAARHCGGRRAASGTDNGQWPQGGGGRGEGDRPLKPPPAPWLAVDWLLFTAFLLLSASGRCGASHSAVSPSYKRCSSFQRDDQVSVVFYTPSGLCSDFFLLIFFLGGGGWGVNDSAEVERACWWRSVEANL